MEMSFSLHYEMIMSLVLTCAHLQLFFLIISLKYEGTNRFGFQYSIWQPAPSSLVIPDFDLTPPKNLAKYLQARDTQSLVMTL